MSVVRLIAAQPNWYVSLKNADNRYIVRPVVAWAQTRHSNDLEPVFVLENGRVTRDYWTLGDGTYCIDGIFQKGPS